MSSFSTDWLALREPADHAARSTRLTATIADVLPSAYDLAVLDLGAGTGSNVRYLAPRLTRHRRQHWLLADHDASLLARADHELSGLDTMYRIETRRVDIASISGEAIASLFAGRGLVTASALLDLVSERWLRAITDLCSANRIAALFALTYDGTTECRPEHDDDALIRDLVNAHQRRDKGFGGPALGADAVMAMERAFADAGYSVRRDRSDWNLSAGSGALQRQLIDGWADAAIETSPDAAARIEDWQSARRAYIDADASTIRVGHEDVAAWPM
jgi:hypothetical protein